MKLAMLQPPGQVICGGMSYTAHNEELSDLMKISEEIKNLPFFFVKAQRAINHDGGPIVLPDIRTLIRKPLEAPYGQVGGEVELGIILKDRTYKVKPQDVYKHILGYTVFNDVTNRTLQLAGYPVSMVKGFHSFGPLGPHMVMADQIPEPQKLRFELRVNGKAQQKGTLADMIFSIETLVSLASDVFMLERGDVITTGSPPGMFAYGLKPGDVIEAEIEDIGVLRNPVVNQ